MYSVVRSMDGIHVPVLQVQNPMHLLETVIVLQITRPERITKECEKFKNKIALEMTVARPRMKAHHFFILAGTTFETVGQGVDREIASGSESPNGENVRKTA